MQTVGEVAPTVDDQRPALHALHGYVPDDDHVPPVQMDVQAAADVAPVDIVHKPDPQAVHETDSC